MDIHRECWERFRKSVENGEMIRSKRWILEDMDRIEAKVKGVDPVYYTAEGDKCFHFSMSCKKLGNNPFRIRVNEISRLGKVACACVKGNSDAVTEDNRR